MAKPSRLLSAEQARRFCQALAVETGTRRNWWVSIQKVAERMGVSVDQATVWADECAIAGYVQHDQSQTVKAEMRRTQLPHSVTVAAGGWTLLAQPARKSRRR